jgi:hypothetical protein
LRAVHAGFDLLMVLLRSCNSINYERTTRGDHLSLSIRTINSCCLVTFLCTHLGTRNAQRFSLDHRRHEWSASDALVDRIHRELSLEERETIRTLSYTFADERTQLFTGTQQATGEIISSDDDDVFWPPFILTYMLAGFKSDAGVGAVGEFHRACRQNTPAAANFDGWEVLTVRKLWLRRIDVAASVRLDGGIPCISARMATYRAAIVRKSNFQHGSPTSIGLGYGNSTAISISMAVSIV